jgi:hypothetical protein
MKAPEDHKAKAIKPAPRSLIEIVTTDLPEIEQVPLFSIDGQVFSIPAEVDASMALRVLDAARRSGMEAAMSGALEELLGEESYQALLNCKGLTKENLEQIMALVQEISLGGLEAAKGK